MANAIVPFIDAGNGSSPNAKWKLYHYIWSYNESFPSGMPTITISNFLIDKLIILNASITYQQSNGYSITVPCHPDTAGNPEELAQSRLGWSGYQMYNGAVLNASVTPNLISQTQFRFQFGFTNTWPMQLMSVLCLLLSYS